VPAEAIVELHWTLSRRQRHLKFDVTRGACRAPGTSFVFVFHSPRISLAQVDDFRTFLGFLVSSVPHLESEYKLNALISFTDLHVGASGVSNE
jgi:hypothetical protein